MTQGEHNWLKNALCRITQRFDQLNMQQLVGVVTASFTLGEHCWLAASRMLTLLEDEKQTEVLNLFAYHLASRYQDNLVQWINRNWKMITQ